MINAAGFKVYPRRIEDALYEHVAWPSAASSESPDPYRGEAPQAYVQLKEGRRTTADELMAFLRAEAIEFELPATIEFETSCRDDDRQAVQEGVARRSWALT